MHGKRSSRSLTTGSSTETESTNITVYDGAVFKLDEHLIRLFRSASLIGLSIPLDLNHLKIAIYETLIANALRNAYVRLTISRGKVQSGLDRTSA